MNWSNYKGWIAVTAAVMSGIASGTVAFPDTISSATQHVIVQWDAFALTIYLLADAIMHFSPDAPSLPKITPVAKALAILAVCLFALAIPHQARAASTNPLNAIGEWATADVDSAIKAATTYPNVQDQVGAACLAEIKTLAGMIKDHPLPVTFHLASDIEYARLIQGELNRVCRVPACAQVFGDMANAAKSLQVTPLPLSFASICAKVPVVGLMLGQ